MKRTLMLLCISMLAASMYASSVRDGCSRHHPVVVTSSDPGSGGIPDIGDGTIIIIDDEVPL